MLNSSPLLVVQVGQIVVGDRQSQIEFLQRTAIDSRNVMVFCFCSAVNVAHDQDRTAECDLFYKIHFKPFAQAERVP
jgi:hypothetical protein